MIKRKAKLFSLALLFGAMLACVGLALAVNSTYPPGRLRIAEIEHFLSKTVRPVYNLSVDKNETYFVSHQNFLVHNCTRGLTYVSRRVGEDATEYTLIGGNGERAILKVSDSTPERLLVDWVENPEGPGRIPGWTNDIHRWIEKNLPQIRITEGRLFRDNEAWFDRWRQGIRKTPPAAFRVDGWSAAAVPGPGPTPHDPGIWVLRVKKSAKE